MEVFWKYLEVFWKYFGSIFQGPFSIGSAEHRIVTRSLAGSLPPDAKSRSVTRGSEKVPGIAKSSRQCIFSEAFLKEKVPAMHKALTIALGKKFPNKGKSSQQCIFSKVFLKEKVPTMHNQCFIDYPFVLFVPARAVSVKESPTRPSVERDLKRTPLCARHVPLP